MGDSANFLTFPDGFQVSMDVMKPWIAKRITELLGFEDDIVVECGSLGPGLPWG